MNRYQEVTTMTVDSTAAHHPTRTFDPVSVSPLSFWALTAEEREPSFKILRDERPISWHPPIEGSLVPAPVDGVWVVTRHEDISYVSKNPELFCSGGGVMIEAIPEELVETALSFLAMDAGKHSTVRRLISSVFTPRQVAKLADQVNRQAVQIVDDLLETQDGDFVQQVSKRLPMWTVYEMVGLPADKREEAAHHAEGSCLGTTPMLPPAESPAKWSMSH
jgi:cytochrome P450